MAEHPEWDTDENYEKYCRMIQEDHPQLLPADRTLWVAFNIAVDESRVSPR